MHQVLYSDTVVPTTTLSAHFIEWGKEALEAKKTEVTEKGNWDHLNPLSGLGKLLRLSLTLQRALAMLLTGSSDNGPNDTVLEGHHCHFTCKVPRGPKP